MKQFGFRIEEAGSAWDLGLLYDETLGGHCDIRPFIWAILLYRGAVKHEQLA